MRLPRLARRPLHDAPLPPMAQRRRWRLPSSVDSKQRTMTLEGAVATGMPANRLDAPADPLTTGRAGIAPPLSTPAPLSLLFPSPAQLCETSEMKPFFRSRVGCLANSPRVISPTSARNVDCSLADRPRVRQGFLAAPPPSSFLRLLSILLPIY